MTKVPPRREADRLKYRAKHPLLERPCVTCGKSYLPKRSDGITCSTECRRARHLVWEKEKRLSDPVWAAKRARFSLEHARAKLLDPVFREKERTRTRTSKFMERYGMTLEERSAMVEAQSGRCAVCGHQAGDALVIDHCHASGRVRQLLCLRCNTGIGMLRDDAGILLAAAEYLRRHSP